MVDVGPQRHLVMRMQVLQSLTEDMYTASVHMLEEYDFTSCHWLLTFPLFTLLSDFFSKKSSDLPVVLLLLELWTRDDHCRSGSAVKQRGML